MVTKDITQVFIFIVSVLRGKIGTGKDFNSLDGII